MIEFDVTQKKFGPIAKIKVIGVGGAGSNTINSIIETGYQAIECIVVNTDVQALELSHAPCKVQIGIKSTKGLGTGANPELGKRAAEEDLDKIMHEVEDADIVFLVAGMGGGTGSGALPVIARSLRERNILTIAIVTKPFSFEGKRRSMVADTAIEQLTKEVDTLLVIPNQKLLEVVDYTVSMIDAFAMINDVLYQSVRGISDIIAKPGHINVDFADVRVIMKDMGLAVMGTGKATGEQRAERATNQAISSPLLENMSIQGAHGVLFNITGGRNLGLHEISEAASIVYEQADENANIIVGSVIDEQLTDEVIVTIIATGFEQSHLYESRDERKVHRVASIKSIDVPHMEKNVQLDTVLCTDTATEETSDSLNIQSEQCDLSVSSECDSAKEDNVMHVEQKESSHEQIFDKDDLDVPSFLRYDSSEKQE